MEQLELIKEHLWKNQVDEAIRELDALLQDDFAGKDEAYYLRGNAYRKQSNWQQALNDYQRAADLNPESPAVHARRALLDILEFYNKDMYNH
ncbi:MAG TPA: tetratricopeptide repeat protein [Candidatus Bacteroides pullicola]|uniref:Tetratricopeptide repeat protein n=1 Tax=Candidatus Bacteroides pullicola TaxID=2838475 RepID=A0A9D2CJF1_9BACE|nr:tetratricopeptide repeat protein [Candidatus Bacteroides pullicola]